METRIQQSYQRCSTRTAQSARFGPCSEALLNFLQNRKGEIAFTAESEGGDRPDCRIDENSHSLQNRKGEIGRRRMAGRDRKEETGRGRSEKGDGAGETGPGGGRGRSEMADVA
ncbi:hypothetical protein ACLOJK_028475 [Asimina triloba]